MLLVSTPSHLSCHMLSRPLSSLPTALCAEDDVWYKPYTDLNVKKEAVQGYFDWEFSLVERIKKDGDVRFDLTPW